MGEREDLTKVLVDLATGSESMWARPLGDGLFELDNSPFYAYDLNYKDVVYAVAMHPDQKPLVRRVERRGGHRTLRARFGDSVPKPHRALLLKGSDRHGVTWEGADHRLFSLDIPPEGNYQAVCDQLWRWEQEGLLEYETCEARVEGSFDDVPNGS
jgi:hypothetical protein